MKRLIVALALVASLGMAGHALAMDKKINIFNGAQYDIYTLYPVSYTHLTLPTKA